MPNKPEGMYFKWPKGCLDMSSYKREKGWPKCPPDPWTHCSSKYTIWHVSGNLHYFLVKFAGNNSSLFFLMLKVPKMFGTKSSIHKFDL